MNELFSKEKRQYTEVVDSTNAWAVRAAEEGAPDGSVFLADCQTAGRGRRGRSWASPAGTSIYMSVLLRPDEIPREDLSMLTLVMGLAAAESVGEICGIRAQIKWPNDVIFEGKKLGGILTETTSDARHVIIGIGLNVNADQFPEELADIATSAKIACGHAVDRTELTEALLDRFAACYAAFRAHRSMMGLRARYEALLANKNAAVRVLDPAGEYDGTARGINERGELLVERADGSVAAVYAGEVSIRGVYGYT